MKKTIFPNFVFSFIWRFFFAAMMVGFLWYGVGCQNKRPSKAYQEAKEWYTKDPNNPQAIEALMMLELLEQDRAQEVIRLYEGHQNILSEQVMARIYYATALCKMAGIQKKPAEQLKYVRKGMHEFDVLVERWPQEGRVLLWMAITYSNFPELLGADTMVVDTIQAINAKITEGSWKFEKEELRQLVYAYTNLAREYKKTVYLEAAKVQAERTGLTNDAAVQQILTSAERSLK
ncbi:MAG: hypothetical protein N2Z76_05570 [Treponemataceae bacterium]|nr:hypothetical protein [Treponemataceae bacterium]